MFLVSVHAAFHDLHVVLDVVEYEGPVQCRIVHVHLHAEWGHLSSECGGLQAPLTFRGARLVDLMKMTGPVETGLRGILGVSVFIIGKFTEPLDEDMLTDIDCHLSF